MIDVINLNERRQANTIEIKFEPINLATRWPCRFCGGHTDKHIVYAVAYLDGEYLSEVCEICMERDLREVMQESPNLQRLAATAVIRQPTLAEWGEAEDAWAANAYGYPVEALNGSIGRVDS